MFSYNVWHTFYQRKLGINQICFGLSKQTLGGDKRCFWKGFVDFLLIQQKHTFNDDLVVISPDWVKRLYMMLILRDETALITEIFIAGFILWLVNIHRYTRILPILSAPSGTGRNCHSLSDYIMIAKPFHATRPFIRIEILRQECQVFSSNLTISNYNFEFICWRCWKIRRGQAYWKKKMAAENAPVINSAKWY